MSARIAPRVSSTFTPTRSPYWRPRNKGESPSAGSFVACDAEGPVSYKFKDGSNPYWTAVQVRNSRYPIAKLETSKDGASFVEAQRQDYNYFLNGSGFGAGSTHRAHHGAERRDLDRHLARSESRADRGRREPVSVTRAREARAAPALLSAAGSTDCRSRAARPTGSPGFVSTACTTRRSTNDRRNSGSRMCSKSERA